MRLARSPLVALLLFIALAPDGAAQDRPPPLVGTLAIVGPQPARSVSELTLRAMVRNDAHQTWRAPVFELATAQLSIEVRDASGRVMPTIPPPVPPAEAPRELLGSGQSRTFHLSLNVFSPELPPGRYTVRWGARQGIASTPVEFVIAPR